MPHIYSTLTGDQEYTLWDAGDPHRVPRANKKVFVNGQANVINKALITPKGAYTHVSDDQLAMLMDIPGFVAHKMSGFITVSEDKVSIEDAVKSMEEKDKGAQMTASEHNAGAERDVTPVEPTVEGTTSDHIVKDKKATEKAKKAKEAAEAKKAKAEAEKEAAEAEAEANKAAKEAEIAKIKAEAEKTPETKKPVTK